MNSASHQPEQKSRKKDKHKKESNDPEYELALKIARNKWLKRFMMFCFCSSCCCFGFCFFCCCFNYCCGMCRPSSQSSSHENETKEEKNEGNNDHE